MCAVVDQSDSRFWVYYVDTEGTICYFKGPKTVDFEDAENNEEYGGPFVVKLGDTLVKTHPDAPKITVVDYMPKGGAWETRIYYLNEKSELNELCWTSGKKEGKWYSGSLNNNGFKALPKAPLTAVVDDHWLKVYYQRADDGPNSAQELWVAWVVPGQTTWSRRKAASKF